MLEMIETEMICIKPYPLTVGTPVTAYGVTTIVTEVYMIDDSNPEHTSYRVGAWEMLMWHCELEMIYPKVDTCTQLGVLHEVSI